MKTLNLESMLPEIKEKLKIRIEELALQLASHKNRTREEAEILLNEMVDAVDEISGKQGGAINYLLIISTPVGDGKNVVGHVSGRRIKASPQFQDELRTKAIPASCSGLNFRDRLEVAFRILFSKPDTSDTVSNEKMDRVISGEEK
jgi:hypothetical protein